jgi:hypothetical protein
MTNNKIIEAVARALCTANGMAVEAPVSEGPLSGQPQWRLFEDEARAAIEAYEAEIVAALTRG